MVAHPATLRRLALATAALCHVALAAGCPALDAQIFGAATDQDLVILPEPRDTVLYGQVSTAPGAAVRFFEAGGAQVPEAEALVDEAGVFQQAFPGALGLRGLGVWAEQGDRALVALLPELPAQPTVFHQEHVLELWATHEAFIDVSVVSTAVSLIVYRAAAGQGVGLDAFEPAEILGAVDQIWELRQSDEDAVLHFEQIVSTLDAAAAAAGAGPAGTPWATTAGLEPGGSFLSLGWLAAAGVDYDGDGVVDTDTAAFDAALAAAAVLVDMGVCYPPDQIRVLWHLDLRPGAQNLNCAEVNHFKWASDDAAKSVFFTGGIHVDNPVCGDDRPDHCLTEAEIDAVNELTGNWVPNVVPMYDDGTHGDPTADDGVHTLRLDLPYIPTATSPDGAGVRLGYKYTFGLPGQGWTDSEEWPGNARILELEDVNGDHLVVRYDIFGDEAGNKDKVNALSPAKGGCGTIQWEAERDPDCAGGSRENQVDLDGDCELDAWDSAGGVAPLTVPCAE